MENLKRAMRDEMGTDVQVKSAKLCFNKVYSYLLYQDIASLFEMLDYRNTLKHQEKPRERYFVFRFMLRLIKKKHPRQYHTLCLRSV